jgi:hypothetical protein
VTTSKEPWTQLATGGLFSAMANRCALGAPQYPPAVTATLGKQVPHPDLSTPPVPTVLIDQGDRQHSVSSRPLDAQQGEVVIVQQRSLHA